MKAKNIKNIVLAAFAGTALLAAAGAQAGDNWRYGHRGHHNKHSHGHHHGHRHVVVRPAPVYYVPAPVYYAPAPVYYVRPAPMLYGHIPVNPNLNIGFRVRF